MITSVEINGTVMDIVNSEAATLETVKAAAVKIDASLANATAYLDGTTVKFRINAGTKGADFTTVEFNGQTMTLSGNGSSDAKAIQREITKIDPSMANASYEVSGSTIRFFIKAGTKG